MSEYVFKLPDLGEGTVEAEIVEWRVKVGDRVEEEDAIAEMMTDKATVEVSSPVTGTVVSTAGQPGDTVAVGSPLIVFDTAADAAPSAQADDARPAASSGNGADTAASPPPVAPAHAPEPVPAPAPAADGNGNGNGRVITSPAIRRRAREAGIDLSLIPGSGPRGRILRRDFDEFLVHRTAAAESAPTTRARALGTDEIKVIGLRRVIAERMTAAKRNIPHFAYVEEIDVTALESLRVHLNERLADDQTKLTFLPLMALALVRALDAFPQCNAVHDAERNVIVRHRAVHLGVATQTPDGLKVPVVRHAEARSLDDVAAEIRRVTGAARDGTAKRDELTGSTITITSLGRLGGIVSTPVINAPEVAIIGVNKAVDRPMVVDGQVVVRRMMNLSSSFDHRFVDGYDAAAMIQRMKELLEQPATIFMG